MSSERSTARTSTSTELRYRHCKAAIASGSIRKQRPEQKEPRATLHARSIPRRPAPKLVFGAMDNDELKRVRIGDVVYKSRDAALARELKAIIERPRKLALRIEAHGKIDETLTLVATRRARPEPLSPKAKCRCKRRRPTH